MSGGRAHRDGGHRPDAIAARAEPAAALRAYRCAGGQPHASGQPPSLAKLGQPCLCYWHRAINDRGGVLRAAVTPGLLDRRAPCLVHGARPVSGVAPWVQRVRNRMV